MSTYLDIQPREMKFVIELNKQSRCTVRLLNKTEQHVAFKVKTTSPKKYCVRPNVGVLQPKGALEFIVIMQALKTAPPDMTCKDKFLIQSRIVTAETKDEDITSEMFPKGGGEGIEESKLRVFLVNHPQSQDASSTTSSLKQHQADEQMGSKASKTEELKTVKSTDVLPVQDMKLEPIKTLKLEPTRSVDSNISKDFESEAAKVMESITRTTTEEFKILEPRIPISEMGEEEQKLFKEVEELKLNMQEFEAKINKAELIISKLTEEKNLAIHDTEKMQQEMAILRKRKVERKLQDGFPLLFVCMVAAITLVVGYGFDP